MSVRALPMAKALVTRGHQVTMLIPPWDDPDRAGQRWIDADVEIINVALPPGIPGVFHLWLTYILVTHVRQLKPDVIHCFKPKAYAGLTHLGLWLLQEFNFHVPRLVVDADDWEQAWNEFLPYSPYQKRFFAWQEEWGLSSADAVTVASRALEGLAGERRNKLGVFYVPNGCMPTEQATNNKIHLDCFDNQTPTILLYSRFLEFRLTRIVTLVRTVAEMMPQARWLIVGAGLDGADKTLETKLTQAGLSQFVRFVGWVASEKLPLYFRAADVAIYPYDDTCINRTKCSVKLIDLLSAGVPVVADAIGQNCEYIKDGETGILVATEDDAAFSQAIVRLLQDPVLRKQFGYSAKQYIQQKFSWSKLVEVVEKAYAI
jgi:glycosyltransferase involved in cell wall biosynthesis